MRGIVVRRRAATLVINMTSGAGCGMMGRRARPTRRAPSEKPPPVRRLRIPICLALAVGLLVAAMPADAARRVHAERLLGQLTVESERGGGYDRDLFRHWVDADGDGCDTRDEVLLAEALIRPSIGSGCGLTGGRWRSPYDGVVVLVARGLDVDHMVPLAEAWRSGADRWDASTREVFANDLAYAPSLVAVTASSNRSKSDRDPASWLPGVNRYRCTYVALWIAVKWRWGLSVDGVERVALQAGLVGCGRRAIVPRPAKARVVEAPAPEASAPEAGAGSGVGAGAGGDDPRFGTCREAIANGYGDYVRGVDPEYDWYRDGDRDGVVCER
jgi:hypothetical protein